MIEVKNLTKHFGDIKVLDHASLTIGDHEIMCLTGPDGAGRSTLLRLLAGVLKGDMGTIVMDNMPVYDNNNTKQHMFFIPTNPYFFMGAKALDMGEYYSRVYPFWNMDRFMEVLNMCGIAPDTRLNRSSDDVKNMFMLACAVASEPRYLLCDETIDKLGETARKIFADILCSELNKGYVTLVVATSDYDSIKHFFEEEMEDTGYELRLFDVGSN